MTTTTFSANRIMHAGKPAVELVVRNYPTSMIPLLEGLGYVVTVDMANRRSIICTTPAEIDAARNPLKDMFDAKGNWIIR